MKGKTFFILLLLLSSVFVYSQENSSFQFGVKAGLGVYSPSMKMESPNKKKLKAGYQVGLFGEYAFTETFYLQTGAFFVTKGARIKGETGSSSSKIYKSQTINLQYLQFPLLAAYKMEMYSDTKVLFNVGPYFAYGIGGKTVIKNSYSDVVDGDTKEKVNSFEDNYMNKMDFGLKYSVGIEFETFIFEWSYDLGLKNILDEKNELRTLIDKGSFKNRGFSLSVGYKF